MRSGRIVAAGLLALMASTTFATPVTMNSPWIQWYSDEYAWTGERTANSFIIGDCRSHTCRGYTHGSRDRVLSIGSPPVTTYHYGELGYDINYSPGASSSTEFDFHMFEEVAASVDAYWTDGRAMGDIRLYRFIVSFDVYETSLYTGTFDIYGGDSAFYSPQDVEYYGVEWINSGTVIGPGRYHTTLTFNDWLTTGYLSAGQSAYASRTTNWSYTFTEVPVPATLPLIGFGLLIAGLVRRR